MVMPGHVVDSCVACLRCFSAASRISAAFLRSGSDIIGSSSDGETRPKAIRVRDALINHSVARRRNSRACGVCSVRSLVQRVCNPPQTATEWRLPLSCRYESKTEAMRRTNGRPCSLSEIWLPVTLTKPSDTNGCSATSADVKRSSDPHSAAMAPMSASRSRDGDTLADVHAPISKQAEHDRGDECEDSTRCERMQIGGETIPSQVPGYGDHETLVPSARQQRRRCAGVKRVSGLAHRAAIVSIRPHAPHEKAR